MAEIENHNFQGHIHYHFPWGNLRQSTNNQNSHLLGLTFAMSSSSKRRRSRSRSCPKSLSNLYFSVNLNTQKTMTTQQKQASQNSNPNPNPKALLRQNNNTLWSLAESPCIWSKNLAKEVHFDRETETDIALQWRKKEGLVKSRQTKPYTIFFVLFFFVFLLLLLLLIWYDISSEVRAIFFWRVFERLNFTEKKKEKKEQNQ
jgi:hypothetical protein